MRRTIFIALLSSCDYKEAHLRVVKLHLKSKQQLEIPWVLVHCAGAEDPYNPFYALVARKFCGERGLRKAFEFRLWEAFRRMREREDGDGDGDGDMSVRKVVNLGKFYATLVAGRGVSLAAVLKKLDFVRLGEWESTFVEVLVTTVMVRVGREEKEGEAFEKVVREVFLRAAGAVGGLRWFVESVVSKGELAVGKHEKAAVEMGWRVAVEALDEVARTGTAAEEVDEED